MILIRLFLVFSYIGLFNFGGGYAMLSFIQQEVVAKHEWLEDSEFTDIVAISQSTPGPIGINCATYTGYRAVMNDTEMQVWCDSVWPEHGHWLLHMFGMFGSTLASFSVLWLPFIVMVIVSKVLLRHKDSLVTQSIFKGLRPAIIGLLATAALSLLNTENFGNPFSSFSWHFSNIEWAGMGEIMHFCISVLIFLTVFFGMRKFRWNIIYTTFICGLLGILIYGIIGL